jgi:hypothetical protein
LLIAVTTGRFLDADFVCARTVGSRVAFLLPIYFTVAAAGILHALSFLESKTAHLTVWVALIVAAISLWLGLRIIGSGSVYDSTEPEC